MFTNTSPCNLAQSPHSLERELWEPQRGQLAWSISLRSTRKAGNQAPALPAPGTEQQLQNQMQTRHCSPGAEAWGLVSKEGGKAPQTDTGLDTQVALGTMR